MGKIKLCFLSIVLYFICLPPSTISESCNSNTFEMICDEVSINNYFGLGYVLRCKTGNLNISASDSSLSSVKHNNKLEVTDNYEIIGLTIHSSSVNFIPNGIKSLFPNLKALNIGSSGLQCVTKKDLKEFGDCLVNLDLEGNKITSIDADLFDDNTNLIYISLSENAIKHIETGFFDNLRKLKNVKRVYFDSAGCMNQEYDTSNDGSMTTFTWKSLKCTDLTAKVETQHLIMNEKFKCMEEETSKAKMQKSLDQIVLVVVSVFVLIIKL